MITKIKIEKTNRIDRPWRIEIFGKSNSVFYGENISECLKYFERFYK